MVHDGKPSARWQQPQRCLPRCEFACVGSQFPSKCRDGTLASSSAEVIKILTAKGPLAVNQDPLALQARLCGNGTDGAGGLWQAYAKPLAGGATAALLLNRNTSAAVNASIVFAACNVSSKAMSVTDLWTGEALGSFAGGWSAVVAPHAHRLVKISPIDRGL